jgi:hypothetical protein
MWKILSLTRTAGQTQEEDSHLGEGEEEEDPLSLANHNSKDRTSIVSIMEEDTTLKGVQKPRRTWQEFSKRKRLSVRNVVPTLTSRKRRGLSLNGRC